jgi:membrane protease subunit (stomatin/prohibitin family)
MSIKNKLASIVVLPAGVVFVIDTFVANMPLVLEGGAWVAGMGIAAMGTQGCKRLLNSLTAEQPAEQEQGAPAPSAPLSAAQAPQELPPAVTVRQVGAAPTREDEVQEAFMRGAYAAMQRNQARIEK